MKTGNSLFDQQFDKASSAHQSNRIPEALQLYKSLIQQFPEQAEPYHRAAVILLQQGNYTNARPLLLKAIELNPTDFTYHTNLGELNIREKKYGEAKHALETSLEVNPQAYESVKKLAKVYRLTGDYNSAIRTYKNYQFDRGDGDIQFQLGTLFLEIGNLQQAEVDLKNSISRRENNAKALNNLAIVYQEQNKYEEAAKYFKKALSVNPNLEDALRNMSLLSSKTGNYQQAKLYMDHLSEVKNGDPMVQWASELIFPEIFQSNDEIQQVRSRLIQVVEGVSKKQMRLEVDKLHQSDIQPPSALIYNGIDDRQLRENYAHLFRSIPNVNLPEWKHEKPHVGFVVTHGHEGVFIKCMRGIIENLSRSKLDVTVVCGFPNGASIMEKSINNPDTRYLMLPKDVGNAVKILANNQFDFLHFWEVGTDVINYFLPFFKAARIQCASWGWPITTGNPKMDYFLSSKNLDAPDSQKHFSEELVLFDRIPTYYYAPKLPKKYISREELKFPDDRVYLIIQNIRKVQPDFDRVIDTILDRDMNGYVVLLGDKMPQIYKTFQSRLGKIKNADRLVFLPRLDLDNYFSAIYHADVILDTLHYTGGANTNYDCFAIGTPVVTVEGQIHRRRFTAAALKQMQINDLICTEIDEYINKAIQIASDKDYRNHLKELILNSKETIFEDKKAVAELEEFILKVCPAINTKRQSNDWNDIKVKIDTHLQNNQLRPALELCTEYANRHKNHLASRLSLASILFKTQNHDGFKTVINQVLQLFHEPDDRAKIAEFHEQLGLVENAIKIYEENISRNPTHFESLNNLGGLYLENSQFAEATLLLEKSLSVKKDFPGTYVNLGIAKENTDQQQAAKTSFLEAAKLSGNLLMELHAKTMVPQLLDTGDQARQVVKEIETALDEFELMDKPRAAEMIEGMAVPPFALTYLGIEESGVRKKWASIYEKLIDPLTCNWNNSKPRVGFLVTLNHTGIFMKAQGGIIDRLNSDKYDIILFAQTGAPYQQLKNRFNQYQVIGLPRDLEKMVHIVHSMKIDVLNLWETGSDVFNFLFPIFKPAKIQAQLWGTAYTTGSSRVDYYVSSKLLETQEGPNFYSEELFLMNTPPAYYHQPIPKEADITRMDFELPHDAFWYICAQNLMKIHPDFDSIVYEILSRTENSILILLDDGKRTEKLRNRMSKKLGQLIDRVYFLQRMQHRRYISLLHLVDVALDPPHFTGANTSYDALGASLPLVTMAGNYQRTRYTKAFYDFIGIEGLSVDNHEDYIHLAIKLREEPSLLKMKIDELNQKKSRLFENQLVVDEFERFLDFAIGKLKIN